MSSKNIVVTVFHDLAKAFFNDFIKALRRQNTNSFCVYIFIDSDNFDLDLSNDLEDFHLINLPNLSITENRIWILNYLLKIDCDIIHFLDSDDTINRDYLKITEKLLCYNDVICHDFDLVDENLNLIKTNYWQSRFNSAETLIPADFIKDKNVIGLGNTSIKKSLLEGVRLKFNSEAPIADWFVFTQLFINKEPRITFTSNATFNYRQHNNLAILLLNDYSDVIKKIHIVRKHFTALQSIGIRRYDHYIKSFDKLLEGFTQLVYYSYKEQRSKQHFFWWEEVFKILAYYEGRY